MVFNLLVLTAAGALCAACSVPAPRIAVAADDPANPAAAVAPFVRPVNVLAGGAMPAAAVPADGMAPGMKMPGMAMPGMAKAMPGMPGMAGSP